MFVRHVITSKDVTYTTAIPSTLDPRLTESDDDVHGAVLKVAVNGGYDSGVLNNSGDIALAGHVSANGHRRFSDESAAEG